ncbi:MAG: ZIP family metal transporter, partial [Solirubrobacteraceae bacterium]
EPDALALEMDAARRRALRVGLTIAAAIGVHNFAEGLAIGVSARAGAISLATVLIIGFALHNATEGFGIVGPLGDVRPSWRWIGLAGLIGGGPTFLGSIVGYAVTSEPLELAFYACAGGAILYVIGEIWNGMRRYGYRELGLLMVSAGFLVGVLTDLVVTYGGG